MAARPATGSSDIDGILDEPIGMYYTGVQKFAVSSDGTVRINKQYTLPNMDGSSGQVLTTNGSGVASWASNSPTMLDDADSDTSVKLIEDTNDEIRFEVDNTIALSIQKSPGNNTRLETIGNSFFIGTDAGLVNTAVDNVGLGSFSLLANTTGFKNTAIGKGAMSANTDGNYNTAVGDAALNNNNGADNVAIGKSALFSGDSGSNNTAVGRSAGYSDNLASSNNTYIGWRAGGRSIINSTEKNNNVCIGYEAGRESQGDNNLFVGFQAGKNEIGDNKLYISNTDTSDPLIYGEFDNDLLKVNGTIELADEIGEIKFTEAGTDRYFVKYNNALNTLAIESTTQNAFKTTTQGDVTLGGDALFIDERGVTSDRLGLNTLAPTATFHMLHFNNGIDSGFKLENRTGNNWWKFYVSSSSNTLQLRNNTSGAVVGTFATTGVYTASDRRLKKNIEKLPYNLSDVMKLETKRYEYDLKSGSGKKTIGFIAQDLKEVYPELVMYEKEGDQYLVNYAGMSVVAIQAIQDQQKIINKIEIENKKLNSENEILKAQINTILSRLENLEK